MIANAFGAACCAAAWLVMGTASLLVMRAGAWGWLGGSVVVIVPGCGGAHGRDGGRGHQVRVRDVAIRR
jgi:hypothetical protein